MGNLIHFLLFAVMAFGQGMEDGWNFQNTSYLRQQGQFMTVQLVVGEPLKFFVLGREEANLDLKGFTLTVQRVAPYPGKVLSLEKQNNFFVVSDSSELKNATELEVKAQSKTKVDAVHFKIENPRP
jgi:hypothetical protein